MIDPDGRSAVYGNASGYRSAEDIYSEGAAKRVAMILEGLRQESDGVSRRKARRRAKAHRLYKANVYSVLENLAQTADKSVVEAKAQELTDKYQHTWWLHYQTSYEGQYDSRRKRKTRSRTVNRFDHTTIKITAYTEPTSETILVDARKEDGITNMGIIHNNVPGGSEVNVEFNPLAVANGLTVFMGHPTHGNELMNFGMVNDKDNLWDKYEFNKDGIMHPSGAALWYVVENTNGTTNLDKWQIRATIKRPAIFKPYVQVVHH